MSELKAITVYDAYWKANSVGEGTGMLVYLKYEADKVIADLEESHKKEVGQLLIEIVELKGQVNGFKNRGNLWHYNAVEEHKKFVQADLRITELKRACKDKDDWCLHTLKENRRHKYKRCLAMAKWCEAENYTECWYHENSERCEWTEKWQKRWLELAEKFKEADDEIKKSYR